MLNKDQQLKILRNIRDNKIEELFIDRTITIDILKYLLSNINYLSQKQIDTLSETLIKEFSEEQLHNIVYLKNIFPNKNHFKLNNSKIRYLIEKLSESYETLDTYIEDNEKLFFNLIIICSKFDSIHMSNLSNFIHNQELSSKCFDELLKNKDILSEEDYLFSITSIIFKDREKEQKDIILKNLNIILKNLNKYYSSESKILSVLLYYNVMTLHTYTKFNSDESSIIKPDLKSLFISYNKWFSEKKYSLKELRSSISFILKYPFFTNEDYRQLIKMLIELNDKYGLNIYTYMNNIHKNYRLPNKDLILYGLKSDNLNSFLIKNNIYLDFYYELLNSDEVNSKEKYKLQKYIKLKYTYTELELYKIQKELDSNNTEEVELIIERN